MSFVLIAGLCQLSAQTPINNDNTKNNRAYVRAGIDPATLITLGYERKIGLPCGEKSLVIFAEWGFSVADLNNSGLKIGGILPVFESGNFKVINIFATVLPLSHLPHLPAGNAISEAQPPVF